MHPALMLHWRVQAYLVGRLDPSSRWEYRGLLPGLRINGRPLRAFTMNRRQPPQARRVVVEGWKPEAPPESPPRETAKEEDTPVAAAGESAPESDEAEAPPSWGPTPPLGIALGGNADPGLWTSGAGAPPGAPGACVRVVGAGSPILTAPPPNTTWTIPGLAD
mgnify:CR=1 FL=1